MDLLNEAATNGMSLVAKPYGMSLPCSPAPMSRTTLNFFAGTVAGTSTQSSTAHTNLHPRIMAASPCNHHYTPGRLTQFTPHAKHRQEGLPEVLYEPLPVCPYVDAQFHTNLNKHPQAVSNHMPLALSLSIPHL